MGLICKKIFLSSVLGFVVLFSFAQVKLADSGTTKVYPEGNRITYIEITGFSANDEEQKIVAREIKSNTDVTRINFMNEGTVCMYDAPKELDENMMVEIINKIWAQVKERQNLLNNKKE